MNDVAVALEHVDFLNGLDGLRVQLLKRRLKLLVIVGIAGDVALLLVSRSSLATCGGNASRRSTLALLYQRPSGNPSFRRPRQVRARARAEGGDDASDDDVPVREGAAPPNFFFKISWTSAMAAVVGLSWFRDYGTRARGSGEVDGVRKLESWRAPSGQLVASKARDGLGEQEATRTALTPSCSKCYRRLQLLTVGRAGEARNCVSKLCPPNCACQAFFRLRINPLPF